MKVRQRLWWVLSGLVLVFCVGFVLATYRFGWSATGFLNKSLWDWLQLLIVPLVLAIIALMFQRANSRTEQQIALDKQHEDLLQTYLDRMSELLLKEKLRSPAIDAEVRNVARVRTLATLEQLDGKRKRSVLQFLHESRLIEKGKSIISLEEANLKDADLRDIILSGADLKGAYLFDADLRDANLSEADLQCAKLNGADLSTAKLQGADLRGARYREKNKRESNGYTLKQTKWPQGFDLKDARAICVDC